MIMVWSRMKQVQCTWMSLDALSVIYHMLVSFLTAGERLLNQARNSEPELFFSLQRVIKRFSTYINISRGHGCVTARGSLVWKGAGVLGGIHMSKRASAIPNARTIHFLQSPKSIVSEYHLWWLSSSDRRHNKCLN